MRRRQTPPAPAPRAFVPVAHGDVERELFAAAVPPPPAQSARAAEGGAPPLEKARAAEGAWLPPRLRADLAGRYGPAGPGRLIAAAYALLAGHEQDPPPSSGSSPGSGPRPGAGTPEPSSTGGA